MTRTVWRLWAAILLWLLMAAAPTARAQAVVQQVLDPASAGHSISYSAWTIDGTTVRLRFMLPTSELKALAARGQPAPNTPAVAQLVSGALTVTTPAGDCVAEDQGEGVGQIYTLALTPGLDRFEVVFDCPQADGMVLHDGLLFDHVSGHVNYAQIRIGAARPVLRMFNSKQQTLALPSGGAKLADTGVDRYALQGAREVLSRIDLLCMVAGLLLLARRWRDLAWIAGALILGYGASILVALSGEVVAGSALTEALIGALILLLGLGSLRADLASLSGPRFGWALLAMGAVLVVVAALVAWRMKDLSTGLVLAGLGLFGLMQLSLLGEPRLRWLVWTPVALFGLLDGMGPAGDLSILQLPQAQLAPVLVGHDAGSAATAAGLAAVVMGGLWLARRWLRPLREAARDLVQAGFVGLGLFWFVSRLYS